MDTVWKVGVPISGGKDNKAKVLNKLVPRCCWHLIPPYPDGACLWLANESHDTHPPRDNLELPLSLSLYTPNTNTQKIRISSLGANGGIVD